jgi:hypothetical protein
LKALNDSRNPVVYEDMTRYAGFIALACLLAPAIAMADDKFEVAGEKRIPPIPHLSPFGQSPIDPIDFGALSPDGRFVLIIRAGRLTTRPLESVEEKQILPQGSIPEGSYWASWSADGKWIYYLQTNPSVQAGVLDLWRVETASSNKELVIKSAAKPYSGRPTVSPDGRSIVFHRDAALMIATVDGKNERVLLERGVSPMGDLTWSPDSTQILGIVYSSNQWGLSLLTVSTGQVKPLAPWKGVIAWIAWPSWSSGPFLCFWPIDAATRATQSANHDIGHPNYQIWHLRLPQEEHTQVTHETVGSFILFGAGAEGHSLVVARAFEPTRWNYLTTLLSIWGAHVPNASDFQTTLLLTLKK